MNEWQAIISEKWKTKINRLAGEIICRNNIYLVSEEGVGIVKIIKMTQHNLNKIKG